MFGRDIILAYFFFFILSMFLKTDISVSGVFLGRKTKKMENNPHFFLLRLHEHFSADGREGNEKMRKKERKLIREKATKILRRLPEVEKREKEKFPRTTKYLK